MKKTVFIVLLVIVIIVLFFPMIRWYRKLQKKNNITVPQNNVIEYQNRKSQIEQGSIDNSNNFISTAIDDLTNERNNLANELQDLATINNDTGVEGVLNTEIDIE